MLRMRVTRVAVHIENRNNKIIIIHEVLLMIAETTMEGLCKHG